MSAAIDEPLATVMVAVPHRAYIASGGVTDDPTLLPDYDCAQPEPGVLLMVMDPDGWATLHRVEARERSTGRIQFGPRTSWPDGSLRARRMP